MKSLLLAAAVSLVALQSAPVMAHPEDGPDGDPVATCSGAGPGQRTYSVKPDRVTQIGYGQYSATFMIRLSVHSAPPEPGTIGVAAHEGAKCEITMPDDTRITLISETPPAAAAACENLAGWIKVKSDPGLNAEIAHGPDSARLRWDPDDEHWGGQKQGCIGGQLNYSIAVAYRDR